MHITPKGVNGSYSLALTFILQDPDSEAGSTETEASNVRDSLV